MVDSVIHLSNNPRLRSNAELTLGAQALVPGQWHKMVLRSDAV